MQISPKTRPTRRCRGSSEKILPTTSPGTRRTVPSALQGRAMNPIIAGTGGTTAHPGSNEGPRLPRPFDGFTSRARCFCKDRCGNARAWAGPIRSNKARTVPVREIAVATRHRTPGTAIRGHAVIRLYAAVQYRSSVAEPYLTSAN